MLEFVTRGVQGSIYSMPSHLAIMYGQLDRRKSLFVCHADFPDILQLEHECDTMMRRCIATGLINRHEAGKVERVKSWPQVFCLMSH